MPRGRNTTLLAVALLAILALWPGRAAAAVSPGVVPQDPVSEADLGLMKQGGVETVRFQVTWASVERTPGIYDWSSLDAFMDGLARHGLEPLPYVFGSPAWVANQPKHPPIDTAADRAAWRSFLRAMAARYGAGGRFWTAREAKAPIRRWQIWNEPNFEFYWDPDPDPKDYAELVKVSARAIRSVERRAEIMLGGVAPVRSGTRWWIYLRKFYDVPGIKASFDAVALHPYSQSMRDLRWQVKRARRIMANANDGRTPLGITEIGWSSGTQRVPLVVGPARQARLLTNSFRLFANPGLRISDADWYAWKDTTAVVPHCSFCAEAGLFDLRGNPKPSWPAYRKAVRRF
ncbi:MAG TPA: glycosyl hydrolase [Solirubrobacterales bacterium]|nr:glycosyl hydrolase [Solirubrobacterales bacterium]